MPVAVAGSCSSNLTPSLGTSICHSAVLKRQKKKKKKKKKILQHMEVQFEARAQIEAAAEVCATAMATPDLSCICNLQHSLRQCRILNPLSKARDGACHPHGCVSGLLTTEPRWEHHLFWNKSFILLVFLSLFFNFCDFNSFGDFMQLFCRMSLNLDMFEVSS